MRRAGSFDRLSCSEEPLSAPGPGEAQIAVRAIGLNFADVCACLGLYSATPAGAFVPGLELAGVVETLGPARAGEPAVLRVGDRVMALTRFGGYATRLNADVRFVRRIPPGWSFAEAAAFPVQALTAWYGITRLGAAGRGSVVLVQSAAGGVGLQALALLKRLGAHPVAVVGQPAKVAFLRERHALPLARCVLRGGGDFAAQLDAALGSLGAPGFDLVFDAVLGEGFRPAFERLAPEGRYVLYGAADFVRPGARPAWPHLLWRWLKRPRLDPLAMISTNRAVLAFNLIWLWQRSERLPEAYAELDAFGLEPPWIGARHPFAAARTALEELQSGATVGKTVLYVGDPE
jgi:NADPH:quinone reductase-like Zn-dependent oxidoreductase